MNDPGPDIPKYEIKRGSWEERLAELLRERPGRAAIAVEAGEANARLAAIVRARLPGAVEIEAGGAAPVKVSELLPALERADAAGPGPLAAICVVGDGDRADARKAGFRLGALAERLWIFVHRAAPPSGLVPTIGEKVARYLEVVEGVAFSEGPRDR